MAFGTRSNSRRRATRVKGLKRGGPQNSFFEAGVSPQQFYVFKETGHGLAIKRFGSDELLAIRRPLCLYDNDKDPIFFEKPILRDGHLDRLADALAVVVKDKDRAPLVDISLSCSSAY